MEPTRNLRLKELREERGLSQTRFAGVAGLNPTTVNQIERGTRQPSARTLAKLASALGVSVPDLFAEEAVTPKTSAPPSSVAPEEDTDEERRYLLALLQMPTNLMGNLALSHRKRVDNLQDYWPYEHSLRSFQWVYEFLCACELLEEELNGPDFAEVVEPWVAQVERGEPVPDVVRQHVLAFKQTLRELFSEVVPAASSWVQRQRERFPNDRDLAEIGRKVEEESLAERRTQEDWEEALRALERMHSIWEEGVPSPVAEGAEAAEHIGKVREGIASLAWLEERRRTKEETDQKESVEEAG